ncbi:bifunctional 4-hydroxy-2-oxoglutarate aldolase/2-dehydro-3-deoxy-phosphogluconate aldolase [Dokdonella ginsengisoli]|uniref:Bifunctional 4-hydroxy-2-oxoglutarate aldolase/2-dehydro-3-deoxy-phosphogluconate aldolase n=1 Tax=Dokdonella ginsengisoli TaxID=363846 RepID=A0ABV9QVG4_9GAMM
MKTHSDFQSSQDTAISALRAAGVLPVVTVDSAAQGVAIARALAQGGLGTIEIALRTPAARDAIAAIKQELPEVIVGAGTVRVPEDIERARSAGADFLVTPGTTAALAEALVESRIPATPAAATPSELLELAARGFRIAKLFPVGALGGLKLIRLLQGPLPDLLLAPSGGITEAETPEYLAQPNVVCVGGSWMVPRDWLAAGKHDEVAAAAARARRLVDAAALA